MLAMILLVLMSIRSWAYDIGLQELCNINNEVEQSTTFAYDTAPQNYCIDIHHSELVTHNRYTAHDDTQPQQNIQGMKNKEYIEMKDELNKAIERFKRSKELSELSIQQLLDLLDIEMTVVDHLKSGKAGSLVADAVELRNKKLKRSIPSIIFVYDKILDLATYNETLNEQWNNIRNDDRQKEVLTLTPRDKKTFLHRMKYMLDYYYSMMRTLQWELSIGPAVERNYVL